jgi:hypothetical protein
LTYSHVQGTNGVDIGVDMKGKTRQYRFETALAYYCLRLVVLLDSLIFRTHRALGKEPVENIMDNNQLHVGNWAGRAGFDNVLRKATQGSKLKGPVQFIR